LSANLEIIEQQQIRQEILEVQERIDRSLYPSVADRAELQELLDRLIVTVYEIVVYTLLINEETRDYSFLEITVYTRLPVGVAEVFRCIETQGFRLQRREAGINRVDVNELKIGRMARRLPPGAVLTDDWCAKILDELFSLQFTAPHSGYYYRKRSGTTSAEYRRRRQQRAQARAKTIQESLDVYGIEEIREEFP
jgi:hypothetical protein